MKTAVPFRAFHCGFSVIRTHHQRRPGKSVGVWQTSLAGLLLLALLGWTVSVHAEYRETMDPKGLTKNLKTDFGLVDDGAQRNQSDVVQRAIDALAAQGGGRLILPKGTYQFSGIYLKSNVHLLVEKGTVIKPYWPEGQKVVVFVLGVPDSRANQGAFVENVSIRGLGGRFIVDYPDRASSKGGGIRTVMCRQVRNFLISDVLVKDCFTKYSAFVFAPAKGDAARKQAVFRPTDGLVRNIEVINSSPGYGLVQMHAGERIHFEGLRAIGGGVTFRLETGAGGHNGGIYDITARNIYCENGAKAVLLGPHTAQNGIVKIDGVVAKSCAWAVTAGPGYVERRNRDDPFYKPGRFGEGTTVRNIHAIFGTNAAISRKEVGMVPKEFLPRLRIEQHDRTAKWLRGPSIGVVRDGTGDSWNLIVENVTSEGFKYNTGVVKVDKTDRANWRDVLNGLPILEQLEQRMQAGDHR